MRTQNDTDRALRNPHLNRNLHLRPPLLAQRNDVMNQTLINPTPLRHARASLQTLNPALVLAVRAIERLAPNLLQFSGHAIVRLNVRDLLMQRRHLEVDPVDRLLVCLPAHPVADPIAKPLHRMYRVSR